MKISQFLADPQLLGADFGAPSWDTWKIVLKAALGETMTEEEAARFVEIAGRQPPSRRVKELWLAIGRRGGKDSAISALVTFLAVFGEFRQFLRRGETCSILCLAVDRQQARIVFNYLAANFQEIPLLRSMLVSANDGVIELNNGVEILVATNSFRSIRGRTVACVVADEISFWRDESSANPDREVINALMPALITLRQAGAMLCAISTVYRKAGLLYDKITANVGQDSDDVLAILAPSVVFNPLLAEPEAAAEIERQRQEDPEHAAAEFDSVWRADLSGFIDRDVAASLVDGGVFERPYDPRHQYHGFVDVASGSGGDSFALSIAHSENGVAVEDLLRVWKPPFSPSQCFAEASDIAGGYSIPTLVGDKYGAGISVEMAATQGAAFEQSAKPKSQIYLDFLHVANSRMCRLLDNRQRFVELINLVRRTRWGGGETVDHPANGHDDAINATAGALMLAATSAQPSLWRRRDLGEPEPLPQRSDALFAVLVMDPQGMVVAMYAARTRFQLPQPRLVLLDCRRLPFGGALRAASDRLRDLAATCGLGVGLPEGDRPRPAMLAASEPLVQQARNAGIAAGVIPDECLGDNLPTMALSAANFVQAGSVRVAAEVFAAAASLPLGPALDLGVAAVAAGDPFAVVATLTIVVGLDPKAGRPRPRPIPPTRNRN